MDGIGWHGFNWRSILFVIGGRHFHCRRHSHQWILASARVDIWHHGINQFRVASEFGLAVTLAWWTGRRECYRLRAARGKARCRGLPMRPYNTVWLSLEPRRFSFSPKCTLVIYYVGTLWIGLFAGIRARHEDCAHSWKIRTVCIHCSVQQIVLWLPGACSSHLHVTDNWSFRVGPSILGKWFLPNSVSVTKYNR